MKRPVLAAGRQGCGGRGPFAGGICAQLLDISQSLPSPWGNDRPPGSWTSPCSKQTQGRLRAGPKHTRVRRRLEFHFPPPRLQSTGEKMLVQGARPAGSRVGDLGSRPSSCVGNGRPGLKTAPGLLLGPWRPAPPSVVVRREGGASTQRLPQGRKSVEEAREPFGGGSELPWNMVPSLILEERMWTAEETQAWGRTVGTGSGDGQWGSGHSTGIGWAGADAPKVGKMPPKSGLRGYAHAHHPLLPSPPAQPLASEPAPLHTPGKPRPA